MMEMNAAKLLRSLLLEFEDDQLIADSIEGETNIKDAIRGVLKDIGDDEIMLAGLKAHIGQLQERMQRIERRHDRRREAIQKAMEIGEIKKLEYPEGMVALRPVPPGLDITDEKLIPAQYFEPQPSRLMRKELKESLKSGKSIAGCQLDNGNISLTIKRS